MSLIYFLAAAPATVSTPPPVLTVPPPPRVPVYVPPPAPPLPVPMVPGQPRAATPKGNPANWATPNDYPSIALRQEIQGTAGFRLMVGPDGKVATCEITSSSGSPILDEATCSLVTRRARFSPALNAEGLPTYGTYSNRVRWSIPEDPPVPLPLAGSYTIAFALDRQGLRSNCRVLRSSGDLASIHPVGVEDCPSSYYGRGYRDRNGQPIARTVTITRTLVIRDVPAARTKEPTLPANLVTDEIPPPRTGTIVRSFIVEADGKQRDCRVESVTGAASAQYRPGVDYCLAGRFIQPFVNRKGEPMRKQVVTTEAIAY